MRFLFAKHIMECKQCGSEILRGELYIRSFFKNDKVTTNYAYHYECYIQVMTERIRKSALYWMGKIPPPKKLGRPVKSSDPKEYRRLMA